MSIDAFAGKIPQFTMGDRLRKAREQAGLESSEFADEIGVSRNTITNYERDKVAPRKIVLKAWALRTGVPIQWLETGIAPSPNPDGLENAAISDSVRSKGFEPPTF
ncbi:helix-turn-helix domain-containing protein [Populibacterium corticicola]|uniref:Helix-turn-helix domain-containing protein n=1 Tax=Populibacterium corticicola TaxID=1812826 RepID=A0ABW5XEE8_9MICO